MPPAWTRGTQYPIQHTTLHSILHNTQPSTRTSHLSSTGRFRFSRMGQGCISQVVTQAKAITPHSLMPLACAVRAMQADSLLLLLLQMSRCAALCPAFAPPASCCCHAARLSVVAACATIIAAAAIMFISLQMQAHSAVVFVTSRPAAHAR